MATSGLSIVNLSSDVLTFVIVAISLYYVLKQKPSQFPYVKTLLALVHVFFEGVIVMEILRNLVTTVAVVDWYTNVASSFILWDVVLLTLISYVVYVRPGGKGILGRLWSVFIRWPHGLVLFGFMVFIAASDIYLVGVHPYSAVELEALDGVILLSTAFTPTFLNLTLATLLFFFAYPTVLLIRATLQVKDPDIRRALMILPFCWGGIGTELFVFNGYLVALGYDLVAVGYVVAAIVFGVAASIFRRATLLSTFFEPIPVPSVKAPPRVTGPSEPPIPPSVPVLMEVDPSTNYETAMKSYVAETASRGSLVYAFTSKGSAIHNGLSSVVGVRFYLLTSTVSYPRPSSDPTELLVPENDTAILLDLLDKTIASTGETPVMFVFDNLSNFILYLGFETCYKFVKQANEILNRSKVSTIYLVTAGAHDERAMSLLRSLFQMHLAYDAGGLRVTRTAATEQKPGKTVETGA